MALLQLPVTSSSANYEFKTTLDGVKYTLAFRFNNRAGRWIMDIKTGSGTIITAGIPLLAGIDFPAQFQHIEGLPHGNLFLVNLADENESPGRDDLGVDVLLMYQEAA
jgi:hypothetical protein